MVGRRGCSIHSLLSLESILGTRTATKQQCKNSPVYCADVTGDVIQIRTKLEMLIEEGEVLKP
jgi:hypothetical protein